jgi:hypothetical protein
MERDIKSVSYDHLIYTSINWQKIGENTLWLLVTFISYNFKVLTFII